MECVAKAGAALLAERLHFLTRAFVSLVGCAVVIEAIIWNLVVAIQSFTGAQRGLETRAVRNDVG